MRKVRYENVLSPKPDPVWMLGDGNCSFRCVAFLEYGDEERHEEVRNEICDWVESALDDFFLWTIGDSDEVTDWLVRMRKTGQYAEMEVISVAGLLYAARIAVFGVSEKEEESAMVLLETVESGGI